MTPCAKSFTAAGGGIFRNVISRESQLGLSYRGSVLDVTFPEEMLDCRPVDSAGSSEPPENGLTSVEFSLHASREVLDGGQSPKEELGRGPLGPRAPCGFPQRVLASSEGPS